MPDHAGTGTIAPCSFPGHLRVKTNDSHPTRRALPALLAGAIAILAAPALAAPPVSDQEAAALAAIAPAATIDQAAVPDRALVMAAAVNRLLPMQAGAAAPAAGTPVEGGMQGLLRRAFALLGTPYRWGGNSPERGFDCSGLVGYVYRTALGIDLPRISRDQARTGELVADRAAMAAGDLVFFGRRGRIDHVGIYIGEGKFVHAPRRGKDVMVSSLDGGYWGNQFMQARRIAL